MGDYAFHLAVHLQRLEYLVTVLADRSDAPVSENVQGVTVLREIHKWDLSAWPHIFHLIRSGSIQVVHLQYLNLSFQNKLFIHFLPLLIRLRCPGVKVAVTFHEFAAPWKRLMLLPLLYFSHESIVTNDHHLEMLRKLCKRLLIFKRPHRIPLAGNIVPVEENRKKRGAVREQWGVLPNEIILVRFGILHDISTPGVLTLLEALKLLLDKGVRVKLLLIGKEEAASKERVLQKIQSLSLESQVILKTNIAPDLISAYLYASDLGLAFYPDGVSEKRTAFLSLLSHGLPVVATERGKTSSELIPGKNILTVPYNAGPEAWSVVIGKLIADDSLLNKIRDGGNLISTRHQWKRIAESTAVLYRQMADGT